MNANTLMVVEAGDGSICEALPRELTDGVHHIWGLSPLEEYFVTVESPPAPQLKLILNWADELAEGIGK